MSVIIALVISLLALTGCSTTIYPVKVYQEGNGTVMDGQFVHDWSGSGEVRFAHLDGEKFTGHYTTVSPQVYHSSMSGLVGITGFGTFGAVSPAFGTTSTNMFYGLISLAGDRGTTAECKYIGNLTGLTTFNGTGMCQDSKARKYTIHLVSDSGARFENAVEATPASTAATKESVRQRGDYRHCAVVAGCGSACC